MKECAVHVIEHTTFSEDYYGYLYCSKNNECKYTVNGIYNRCNDDYTVHSKGLCTDSR